MAEAAGMSPDSCQLHDGSGLILLNQAYDQNNNLCYTPDTFVSPYDHELWGKPAQKTLDAAVKIAGTDDPRPGLEVLRAAQSDMRNASPYDRLDHSAFALGTIVMAGLERGIRGERPHVRASDTLIFTRAAAEALRELPRGQYLLGAAATHACLNSAYAALLPGGDVRATSRYLNAANGTLNQTEEFEGRKGWEESIRQWIASSREMLTTEPTPGARQQLMNIGYVAAFAPTGRLEQLAADHHVAQA